MTREVMRVALRLLFVLALVLLFACSVITGSLPETPTRIPSP